MDSGIAKGIVLAALWLGAAFGLHAQTVVEYIHTDALGTPVAVTNSAGAVIERSVYEPYGQLINRPLTDGPGFTAHVQDAATGLTYMQQRYYDPQLGGFLSADPVTAYSSPVGQFNRYRYANNNPYKFVDPDGRQAKDRGSLCDKHASRCKAVIQVNPSDGGTPSLKNQGSMPTAIGTRPVLSPSSGTGIGVGTGLRALASTVSAATVATAFGLAALVYSPDLADGTRPMTGLLDQSLDVARWHAVSGMPVYRIWGGGSTAFGASWTPVNPLALRIAGFDVRDYAGLPSVNTGSFVTMGILHNPAGVIDIRPAIGLEGHRGGLVEFVIPNPFRSIQYINTFSVNPPF